MTDSSAPINPYRVIWDFMQAIPPEDAIVTHDSGSPRDQIVPFYRSNGPRTYLGWGKSHGLGTGLGLVIGAKLAEPQKVCVNFMGDAAFGMTGLDFETAVRCHIPIITVVLNNSTMAAETSGMATSHELFNTRAMGLCRADRGPQRSHSRFSSGPAGDGARWNSGAFAVHYLVGDRSLVQARILELSTVGGQQSEMTPES